MSKKDFYETPIKHHCTTCVSVGVPGSGKSYVALNFIKLWIQNKVFDEYHLILPCYKFEQKNSYAFLKQYENEKWMHIYPCYTDLIGNYLVKQGKREDKDKKKILFFIDDSTTQKKSLFTNQNIIDLAVMSRHYNIHVWYICHVSKGIIPTSVRAQIKFCFIYRINPSQVEVVYEEFWSNRDITNKKDFKEFYYNEIDIEGEPHPCLFIDKLNMKYSTDVNTWFKSAA